MAWILDLDGVVWLADRPSRARWTPSPTARRGRARALPHQQLVGTRRRLSRQARGSRGSVGRGRPAHVGPGGGAAARTRHARARVRGTGRRRGAAGARGRRRCARAVADAVVVGWHTDFDYARLTAAFRAVHARRPAHRHERRRRPIRRPTVCCPGAARSSPRWRRRPASSPEIAGKPHAPMAALVRDRARRRRTSSRQRALVGDRAVDRWADGGAARRAVRAGAHGRDDAGRCSLTRRNRGGWRTISSTLVAVSSRCRPTAGRRAARGGRRTCRRRR